MGLWSWVFLGYLGIRQALRTMQQDARPTHTHRQDARGSSRSFAEVARATPTMRAIQELLFITAVPNLQLFARGEGDSGANGTKPQVNFFHTFFGMKSQENNN